MKTLKIEKQKTKNIHTKEPDCLLKLRNWENINIDSKLALISVIPYF